MYAAVRPLGLPIKGYAALLAVVSAAAVVAGGAVNYTHARNNPGADPYMPRPQLVVPMTPAAPAEPILREKVKVLPPAGDAHEQGPLVSGIEPKTAPVLANDNRQPVRAKATGAIEYATPAVPATTGASGAMQRAATGAADCGGARAGSKRVTADSDCRASGAVGQGSVGEMTIGAGSVTVVPTQ